MRLRVGLGMALALALLAAPLVAGAQPVGRPARVGLLCAARCEGPSFEVFRDGLKDRGWVESRTLVLETRAASGQFDRLPALARELADLKLDVLVAGGPQPVQRSADKARAPRL